MSLNRDAYDTPLVFAGFFLPFCDRAFFDREVLQVRVVYVLAELTALVLREDPTFAVGLKLQGAYLRPLTVQDMPDFVHFFVV